MWEFCLRRNYSIESETSFHFVCLFCCCLMSIDIRMKSTTSMSSRSISLFILMLFISCMLAHLELVVAFLQKSILCWIIMEWKSRTCFDIVGLLKWSCFVFIEMNKGMIMGKYNEWLLSNYKTVFVWFISILINNAFCLILWWFFFVKHSGLSFSYLIFQ